MSEATHRQRERRYDGVDSRTQHGVVLRVEQPGGHLSYQFRLTECPACGAEIAPYDNTDAHIRKHDPADFGL